MMIVKLTGVFILLLTLSCQQAGRDKNQLFTEDPDCVQIVMFHLAQRCESCNAVETETRAILENEYKDQLDSGEIRFLTFEIQSENGRELARRLKASGQSLFVVKGDSITDLTTEAFFFASTHPERYHSALTKELEKYFR